VLPCGLGLSSWWSLVSSSKFHPRRTRPSNHVKAKASSGFILDYYVIVMGFIRHDYYFRAKLCSFGVDRPSSISTLAPWAVATHHQENLAVPPNHSSCSQGIVKIVSVAVVMDNNYLGCEVPFPEDITGSFVGLHLNSVFRIKAAIIHHRIIACCQRHYFSS
jgi:hypothetical protein